jgi:hypothetical protein
MWVDGMWTVQWLPMAVRHVLTIHMYSLPTTCAHYWSGLPTCIPMW